jgi:hypothetical protein
VATLNESIQARNTQQRKIVSRRRADFDMRQESRTRKRNQKKKEQSTNTKNKKDQYVIF